jgi:hypothetical protein
MSNDVALGDLNHDGLLDIVTANTAAWSGEFTDEAPTLGAAILYGQRTGGFRTAQKIPTDAPVQFVEVGHFNFDRRLDIALGGPVANSPAVLPGVSKVFVALNTWLGQFRLAPPVEFTGRLLAMDAGDLDRVRFSDVAVALDVGQRNIDTESAVLVLRNRGYGTLSADKPIRSTMPVLTDLAIDDFNNDRWPDIATVGNNPLSLAPVDVGAVSVFQNLRGRFTTAKDFPTIPWHATQLTTGRFTFDRLSDIAVALPRPSSVGVFLNTTPTISPFLDPVSLETTAGSLLDQAPLARFITTGPAAGPQDFKASIFWGDGTPATEGTITVSALDGFFVLGSHTYTTPGQYTIAILVSWPATGASQILYASVEVS